LFFYFVIIQIDTEHLAPGYTDAPFRPSKHVIAGGPIILNSLGSDKQRDNQLGFYLDKRPPESVWISIRKEMLEFLCGNETTYTKLREQLYSLKEGNTKLIIGIIAGYFSTKLGIPIVTLTGLIALILGVILKTGRNGFCKYYYKP